MSNTDREQPVVVSEETTDAAPRSAEAEKKLGLSMLTKIALGALVISSLIICITSIMIYNQNKREVVETQEEKTKYTELVKKLKYYLDEDVDDEYIEDIARDLYDMFYPDEDVYYNDVND